jgi:hypothetical protein
VWGIAGICSAPWNTRLFDAARVSKPARILKTRCYRLVVSFSVARVLMLRFGRVCICTSNTACTVRGLHAAHALWVRLLLLLLSSPEGGVPCAIGFSPRRFATYYAGTGLRSTAPAACAPAPQQRHMSALLLFGCRFVGACKSVCALRLFGGNLHFVLKEALQHSA